MIPDNRYRAAVVTVVVLWAVGGLLALMLAIPTSAEWVQVVDDAIHRVVVVNEVAILVAAGEVLAFIGSAVVMTPFILVVAAILVFKKRWPALWTWFLAIGISQLLNTPLKVLYARERPLLPLVETTSYAFPSGHAITGAVVAMALVIVMAPSAPKRRYFAIAAVVYALAMAWSRVYVRAHWLSDVTAGFAFGAAAAITAALIVDRVRIRRAA